MRDAPDLKHIIAVGGDSAPELEGCLAWSDLLARGAEQSAKRSMLDWLRPSADDVTELIFTSGTTGEPKGVLHTANTLGAPVQSMIRCHRLTAGDVFHMARPSATRRASCWVEHDTRSLRIFLCGGAPIPRPVASEAVGRLGCRLLPQWGLTETGPVTTTLPEDPLERTTTTDGRAYPEMELCVRDPSGGVCQPGQEGELYTHGAFVFAGYVQGRRFTERSFTADGWLTTGDLAIMDAQGYIRVTGRTKDIIIRGGENVPVKEIEDVLIQHPKIRDVALVGLAVPRLGEIACACIIPEPDETLDLEDRREFLAAQQVTRQFWPERLQLMDAFPTTPSGKVQKFQLRQMLEAEESVEPVATVR